VCAADLSGDPLAALTAGVRAVACSRWHGLIVSRARADLHRVGASAQGSSDDDARPGAGGAIEARFVKTAPADGSILPFMNSQMLVTLPLTTRDPGHDPARDFRPLGQIATLPVAVVVPTGTFKTLR
jgi:hypothetical protein